MAKNLLTKDYPVFDCDSHIVEPGVIWSDYVEPEYRDAVRKGFWKEDEADGSFQITLNDKPNMRREGQTAFFGAVTRPGMTHHDVGNLRVGVDHCPMPEGAYEPHARLRDLDLMGIDQAMLFPTFCGMWFTGIEDPKAAMGVARAYNNWVADYAKADSRRLHAAGIFPQHENDGAIAEIRRMAEMGFRCVVIRPVFVADRYPLHPSFDPVWEAIAEAGLVACMHPFPSTPRILEPTCSATFIDRTSEGAGLVRRVEGGRPQGISVSESLCFGHDAQIFLMNMFHRDFFVKHPELKFAVLESNAAWLPALLDKADGRIVVWKASRGTEVSGKPSEVWYNGKNWLGFESDERTVFELWKHFENTGIWAGDYPHLDAEDAWEGIEHMLAAGVPRDVQAKLMGGNALEMYGIEPLLCVTKQEDVPRPSFLEGR